jgi:hypothetical protein
MIIIEGEDLDCYTAYKIILDWISLIRCGKLIFIEENFIDNSYQEIQI